MKKYPSVTQVLSKYIDWSGVHPEVLAAACARGSAVDQYCNAVALGLYASAPESYAGYCHSFDAWFDEMVVEVIAVQPELIDQKLGFKGHPDLVARLKGNLGIVVVDNKTPVVIHKLWAAQVSAYVHLARLQYGPEVKRCASLRLRADGGPAMYKDYPDSAQYYQAFLCALFAHQFFVM